MGVTLNNYSQRASSRTCGTRLRKNIEQAKAFWDDYKNRKHEGD